MNTKEFEAGEIRGTLYGKEGAHTIIYILEPIPITRKVVFLAEEYPVTLCALSGMNWNRDLSPWPAKKVFKGEDDFGGKGDAFIETLVDEVFPKAESMAPSVSRRMMAGISMSGLFPSTWRRNMKNWKASPPSPAPCGSPALETT